MDTAYGLLLLLANDFLLLLFFSLALISEFPHFSLKTTGGRQAQGCDFAGRQKSHPLVVPKIFGQMAGPIGGVC